MTAAGNYNEDIATKIRESIREAGFLEQNSIANVLEQIINFSEQDKIKFLEAMRELFGRPPEDQQKVIQALKTAIARSNSNEQLSNGGPGGLRKPGKLVLTPVPEAPKRAESNRKRKQAPENEAKSGSQLADASGDPAAKRAKLNNGASSSSSAMPAKKTESLPKVADMGRHSFHDAAPAAPAPSSNAANKPAEEEVLAKTEELEDTLPEQSPEVTETPSTLQFAQPRPYGF